MRGIHFFIPLLAACAIIPYGCNKIGPETPEPEPEKTPVIVLDQSDFDISADGGELSVPYRVENPAGTGSVSAESNVPWVTLSTVSVSEVVFEVEENEVTESRDAEVTIIYTFGENQETVSEKATIHQGEKIPDPEIVVETTEIEVAPEGGDVTVALSVLNPAEDGVMSAATDAEWITVVTADESGVSLKVGENTSVTERSAVLVITYTYRNGKTVDAEVTIKQAVPVHADYYLPEAYAYAEYYDYGEVFRYFRIYFSDKEIVDGQFAEDAFKYDLTIYVTGIEDNSNPVPPDGSYVYGKDLTPGQFSGWVYLANDTAGFGILEGTMDIAKDGEYLSIETNITDEYGDTHYVKYYGIPSFDIAFQL